MPFWVWFLIFLGIGLFGLAILGWIAWELVFKFTKLQQESEKLRASLATLQLEIDTAESYLKPADNLSDDPVKLTGRWLARKSLHEQEKSAKQRRLIARFSKRK
jgi:hypothetical protein